MTLDSYVKGPNNTICREWVWKGLPLGSGQESGPGFVRTHTKVGLDCIAKPYIDVVRKVWTEPRPCIVLGLKPMEKPSTQKKNYKF